MVEAPLVMYIPTLTHSSYFFSRLCPEDAKHLMCKGSGGWWHASDGCHNTRLPPNPSLTSD